MNYLVTALSASYFVFHRNGRWSFLSSSAFGHQVSAFAAGGFGSSSTPKGNSNKKEKKQQQQATKQKRSGLSDMRDTGTIMPPTPTASAETTDDGQRKLDKWGLPVATLEDLFPPLSSEVELLPVESCEDTILLSDIQHCLRDHVDLQLSQFFDEDCRCKIPNSDGSTTRIRLLHRSPPVLALDNFLTVAECHEIQEQSASPLAHQVDSATFHGSLSTRTSTSWFCQYSNVPILLAKANSLLNIPLETMEEPQIVRYERGQEFSWHCDEVPASQLDNGGQRVATLLVYLTSVPDKKGGGTIFRDLRQPGSDTTNELVMQPKQGSALLFFPAFADGTPDDRTLHQSQVLDWDKSKWIVQMWVHQRQYNAALPAGNSNEAARTVMEETIEKLGYND